MRRFERPLKLFLKRPNFCGRCYNPLKTQALIEMTPIGSLAQVAVAAQVGVVSFAAHHEQTRQQRQQKLPVRFAKRPTVSSRPVRISFRLSICVSLFVVSTLYPMDGFLHSWDPKTVRSVEGCSNAEITERLYITIGTVKTHVRNILIEILTALKGQ